MSHLDNNKKISLINIPGTHDTCARHGGDLVECQSMDLSLQLESGIRFIDIRCRHKDNKFAIHHGSIFQKLWFNEVLDVCGKFLANNPSECIIMLVKEEYKQGGCTRSFYDTFYWYLENCKNCSWYLGNQIPTLGNIRGKVVLLRRFNASRQIGIDVSQWQDNATFEQTNDNKITYHIQDEYKVPTLFDRAKKWNKITDTLINANSTSSWIPNKIFLNFTSGVSGGAYPNAVASYINPKLLEYLHDRTHIYIRGYGIVPMDFPPQDLIDAIIELSLKDKYADRLVFLQSEANGKYVCAEDGGNKPLIANRNAASTWETFRIIDKGDNNIALQAAANRKFVCAENGGKESLIANRDVVDIWETFKLINLENNYVFLKSAANSKYICAEDGGNKPLIANRDAASTWEKFKLIPI